MPDSIDGSLVVAALSLVVSVLAYWPANKKAEEAKKGLFRCVTRSDALGSLTEGSSLHRFRRPSVIRAVAASNLRLRWFVFKKCPPLSPKGIVGFEGASCDVPKLKAHRDHKYVKRDPP